MTMPPWWLFPATLWSSTVRAPSVSTRLSRIPSIVPFLPDFARRSGRIVAGAANAFSRKDLFTSWAMIGIPSAAIPEPAGVIEVVMRGDHVPDRLVRDEGFYLGQHRRRALVVQW